ncbi:MAG: penicillin-binding protein 2 [Alphaproteobacteria bacterium]|nr:penicillin-binding protein 2 [Alphaproteobacteria bacterium]
MYKGIGNNLYSLTTRSVKIAKQRVLLAISIFVILFSILIIRLAQVMVCNSKNGVCANYTVAPQVISRADIIDRNGIIIATSLPTVSLYACPHEMINIKEAAQKIATVFPEINEQDMFKKLSSAKKFLWIKRNLSPTQEQEVLNQGVPGMHFLKTERRVYPDKNLLAHIIGGTDIDNIGIAGLEKVFDDVLRESSEPIRLSIDVKIQHAVHDELRKSIEEFHALGGAAIVMEISTGSILAMISLPDFDPNKNSDPSSPERFNMATSSAIEPGSTAKLFNTTMALESGRITPFTKFDARFPLKVGRFTVHDFKGKGMFLTVEEILKYSSNIGSAHIALELGREHQKKFYKDIGLLDTVSCELSETQHTLYPRFWSDAAAVTISYGHGIALSPLHMITTISGILNDGILNAPTLLQRETAGEGRRIVSKKTSDQLKILMRLNVTEGANKFAEVKGYFVGGKSGTAEKQKNGRYQKDANYAGFVGAFPMPTPKYSVYLVLNEPKATPKTHGYKTAGWNAAPTAAAIIKRIGPMLGIMPSEKAEPDWKEELRKIR